MGHWMIPRYHQSQEMSRGHLRQIFLFYFVVSCPSRQRLWRPDFSLYASCASFQTSCYPANSWQPPEDLTRKHCNDKLQPAVSDTWSTDSTIFFILTISTAASDIPKPWVASVMIIESLQKHQTDVSNLSSLKGAHKHWLKSHQGSQHGSRINWVGQVAKNDSIQNSLVMKRSIFCLFSLAMSKQWNYLQWALHLNEC